MANGGVVVSSGTGFAQPRTPVDPNTIDLGEYNGGALTSQAAAEALGGWNDPRGQMWKGDRSGKPGTYAAGLAMNSTSPQAPTGGSAGPGPAFAGIQNTPSTGRSTANGGSTPGSTAGGNAGTGTAAPFNLSQQQPSTSGSPSGAPSINGGQVVGPTNWDVTPNMTVASQLEKVISSDSPLMQRARMQAQQDALARGQQNTTMAGTAGEAAVLDRALPIASQDASTFARAGEVNTGAANTFNLAGNEFARNATMANFNLSANDWAAGQQAGRAETAAERAAGRVETQAQRDFARSQGGADANLRRDQTLAASNAELNKTQQAIATQNQLREGYINAVNNARRDYANALTNISGSSTMSADVKAEALHNLATTYNTIIANYTKLLGWDHPESWLIDDGGPGGGNTSAAPPTPAPGPGNREQA